MTQTIFCLVSYAGHRMQAIKERLKYKVSFVAAAQKLLYSPSDVAVPRGPEDKHKMNMKYSKSISANYAFIPGISARSMSMGLTRAS